MRQEIKPRARQTWPSGRGGVAGRVPAVGVERDCARSSGAGHGGLRHGRIQRGARGSAGILKLLNGTAVTDALSECEKVRFIESIVTPRPALFCPI